MAPDVGGGERVAVFVGRRRAGEDGGAARPGQRLDRADQAQRGELRRLAGAGAEPGAGDQAGRLGDAEGALEGARGRCSPLAAAIAAATGLARTGGFGPGPRKWCFGGLCLWWKM